VWAEVTEILKISAGQSFESVAQLWLNDKKYKIVNVLTSAVL
jgi:hypothetical protein